MNLPITPKLSSPVQYDIGGVDVAQAWILYKKFAKKSNNPDTTMRAFAAGWNAAKQHYNIGDKE